MAIVYLRYREVVNVNATWPPEVIEQRLLWSLLCSCTLVIANAWQCCHLWLFWRFRFVFLDSMGAGNSALLWEAKKQHSTPIWVGTPTLSFLFTSPSTETNKACHRSLLSSLCLEKEATLVDQLPWCLDKLTATVRWASWLFCASRF